MTRKVSNFVTNNTKKRSIFSLIYLNNTIKTQRVEPQVFNKRIRIGLLLSFKDKGFEVKKTPVLALMIHLKKEHLRN